MAIDEHQIRIQWPGTNLSCEWRYVRTIAKTHEYLCFMGGEILGIAVPIRIELTRAHVGVDPGPSGAATAAAHARAVGTLQRRLEVSSRIAARPDARHSTTARQQDAVPMTVEGTVDHSLNRLKR